MGQFRKTSYFLVAIISLFLFVNNADAYVLIDYGSNGNRITPVNKNITNVNSNWGYSGTAPDIHSPWLWSPSQFWYYGDAKGSYISVNADYYVGIKVEDYSDSSLNNYLGTASNTITSSNLRCAIGSAVGVGYDSTYIPTVSNFNVTYARSNASNDFAYQYLYHITFNYHQQIKTVAKNNTNMSCWFERNPSSGLFAQGISGLYDASLYYYYYNSNFQYAVTEDPNTAILNDINSAMNETNDKLDEQIKQNEEIKKQQEETNDYLKDDTEPNADISALGNVQGLLPEGPVDSLLNIPFMFLSVITSSMGGVCVPMQCSFVFDSTLTLPCFSEEFYGNVPTILMNFLSLIPSAFILIKYFKHLYKKVDRAVSMDSNADDQWGAI